MNSNSSILDLFSPEVAADVEAAAGFAGAVETLGKKDSSALAAMAAVNTLLGQAIESDTSFVKPSLKAFGSALSIAALAESASDGEFNLADIAAASASIGSALSRINVPAAQVAAAYFNTYAIALPWLVDRGDLLGAWFAETDFGQWAFHQLIDRNTAFCFEQAQSWTRPRRVDPLAIDLDGDGIETTAIGHWQTTTLFDHDGDGVAEGTGWLKADDGWLVRDLDGNGRIDSGAELFGDQTRVADGGKASEGFAALSALDSNGDGRVDAADGAFDELKVWQDFNQDGRSQASELSSLTDLGISSIGLDAVVDGRSQNGNTITARSSFTRADGSTGIVGNLELSASTFFTDFRHGSSMNTDLPDVHGSGAVRNLGDAAGLSTQLSSLLAAYATSDWSAQQAGLDALIDSWAATSEMPTMVERAESAGCLVLYEFGGQDLLSDEAVIEGFSGVSMTGQATTPSGSRLHSQAIADAMNPEARTDYQEWFRLIGVLERFNGQEFVSFDRPTATNTAVTINPALMTDGGSVVGGGLQIVRIRIEQPQLDLLAQAYDALRGSVYDSLLVQTRLPKFLDQVTLDAGQGGVGLDFSGLDAAFDAAFVEDDAEAAWDLIDLDRLLGAQMADAGWTPMAYLSNRLSDLDISLSPDAVDALEELGVGVVADAQGGQRLANGVLPDLVGRGGVDELTGSESVNRLFGGGGNDHLIGKGGDDHLHGGRGDDQLDGGKGADYLDGGAGNDRLTTHYNHGGTQFRGGRGNDVLTGSYRNDTYLYRLGDGRDVIRDTYHYSGVDRLVFEDLTSEDITVTREGSSLVMNVTADGGQVKVEKWYAADYNRVEEVHFSDGIVWGVDLMHEKGLDLYGSDLDETLSGLNNQADRLFGQNGHDVLNGNNGNDELFGGPGNDLLDGGSGADLLDGGSGNDTLVTHYNHGGTQFRGGLGNDVMTGSYRDDTYRYRRGDGCDVIRDSYHYSGQDRVVLEDLNPDDVKIMRQGQTLIIDISDDQGQLKIENWYAADYHRIEQLQFANGDVWGVDKLHQLGLEVRGSDENDALLGLDNQSDHLSGLGGDDVLEGGNGNDLLYGGAGNDRLDGGKGVDYLDGGSGNDSLTSYYNQGGSQFRGGTGDDEIIGTYRDDTYYYRKGDGRDVIRDRYHYSGQDRLVLEDLTTDDVNVARTDQSLIIEVLEDGGQIKIENWYAADYYRIEKVVFGDGTTWGVGQMHNSGLEVYGTASTDTLYGLDNQDDRLHGAGGDDALYGKRGNDFLYGGAGNDMIDGGRGANYLDGGSGNDRLTAHYNQGGNQFRGGTGDDVIIGTYRDDIYCYRSGDGRDVIRDSYHYSGSDQLRFEDLYSDDVTITRQGAALAINMLKDDGQVLIEDWYKADYYRIEQVTFADGVNWNVAQMHDAGLEIHGSELDDDLHGLDNQADRLHGEAGDDVLSGRNGNDWLYGGAGDDRLDGGRGADYLDGGTGNDSLTTYYNQGGTRFIGGTGDDVLTGSYRDDTYVYREGDGKDVIRELYHYSGNDLLVFEGIAHDALWFERRGDDLRIDILGDDGRVTVEDWFRSSVHRVERLQSADGLALTNSGVDQLVAAMSAFAKPETSTETSISGALPEELQPVLAAAWNAT